MASWGVAELPPETGSLSLWWERTVGWGSLALTPAYIAMAGMHYGLWPPFLKGGRRGFVQPHCPSSAALRSSCAGFSPNQTRSSA
jgi:hypothetical protein